MAAFDTRMMLTSWSLAWSELYVTLGRLLRNCDLKMIPASSTVETIRYADEFGPRIKEGHPGLLVV